jgi:hypothetical protein
VLLDCAENTGKYLRKLYIIFQCSRCDPRIRQSKTSRIPLEKNKFTLSSETSRPSIVVYFRTLFMLLTKAKFTHLFQKRVPYKTQRSFVFWSHTSDGRYRVLGIRYQRYHKQRYRYRLLTWHRPILAPFFKRLV